MSVKFNCQDCLPLESVVDIIITEKFHGDLMRQEVFSMNQMEIENAIKVLQWALKFLQLGINNASNTNQ